MAQRGQGSMMDTNRQSFRTRLACKATGACNICLADVGWKPEGAPESCKKNCVCSGSTASPQLARWCGPASVRQTDARDDTVAADGDDTTAACFESRRGRFSVMPSRPAIDVAVVTASSSGICAEVFSSSSVGISAPLRIIPRHELSSPGNVDRTCDGEASAAGTKPSVERQDESPDGRYVRLSDEIGRGSFKAVYRGLDTRTGVAVAWCELLDQSWEADEVRTRCRNEVVTTLRTLQHPNVLQFYESWSCENSLHRSTVLVTELASGTLKSYIRLFPRVAKSVLVNWCRQILSGLDFLHSQSPPVIHSDLRCDNVFVVDHTGVVKIGYLGLAMMKSSHGQKSVAARSGMPEHMAPETYEQSYDEAADVYAFGMCMLEMATSEMPYHECATATLVVAKVCAGILPESAERIECSDVRDIVLECISTDKTKRPTVASLLGRALFAPEQDMTVEICDPSPSSMSLDRSSSSQPGVQSQVVTLALRFGLHRHRDVARRRHEAIRFRFDLVQDTEDGVAQSLLTAGLVHKEEVNLVKRLIRQRLAHVRDARWPQCNLTGAQAPALSGVSSWLDRNTSNSMHHKHAAEIDVLLERQRLEVEARKVLDAHAPSASSAAGGYDSAENSSSSRSEVLACGCLISRCAEHAHCTFSGWLATAGANIAQRCNYRQLDDSRVAVALAAVRAVERALGKAVAPAASDQSEEVRESRLRAVTIPSTQATGQTVNYVKWYLRSGLPYAPASAPPLLGGGLSSSDETRQGATGRRRKFESSATAAANDDEERVIVGHYNGSRDVLDGRCFRNNAALPRILAVSPDRERALRTSITRERASSLNRAACVADRVVTPEKELRQFALMDCHRHQPPGPLQQVPQPMADFKSRANPLSHGLERSAARTQQQIPAAAEACHHQQLQQQQTITLKLARKKDLHESAIHVLNAVSRGGRSP